MARVEKQLIWLHSYIPKKGRVLSGNLLSFSTQLAIVLPIVTFYVQPYAALFLVPPSFLAKNIMTISEPGNKVK